MFLFCVFRNFYFYIPFISYHTARIFASAELRILHFFHQLNVRNDEAILLPIISKIAYHSLREIEKWIKIRIFRKSISIAL